MKFLIFPIITIFLYSFIQTDYIFQRFEACEWSPVLGDYTLCNFSAPIDDYYYCHCRSTCPNLPHLVYISFRGTGFSPYETNITWTRRFVVGKSSQVYFRWNITQTWDSQTPSATTILTLSFMASWMKNLVPLCVLQPNPSVFQVWECKSYLPPPDDYFNWGWFILDYQSLANPKNYNLDTFLILDGFIL